MKLPLSEGLEENNGQRDHQRNGEDQGLETVQDERELEREREELERYLIREEKYSHREKIFG